MARRDEYESRVEKFLIPIMEENNFELVDVEYVKEAGTWYLRAYIDKEGGFTVDDCEMVSRRLSDWLDKEERQKDFSGILTAYDADTVTIRYEDGSESTFNRKDIALIRLAFDF